MNNVPAAATGSIGDLTSGVELSRGLERGLRARPAESSLRAGGERDRLSNRDARFGSGSVWSKRERLMRLSESSIASGAHRIWFYG